MAYLLVFILALAVGAGVYYLTLRSGPVGAHAQQGSHGFEAIPAVGSAPPDPSTYIPVTGAGPDWQSRLTGVFGLAVAVVLGAAALAAALVTGWSLLVKLVGGGDSGAA